MSPIVMRINLNCYQIELHKVEDLKGERQS